MGNMQSLALLILLVIIGFVAGYFCGMEHRRTHKRNTEFKIRNLDDE